MKKQNSDQLPDPELVLRAAEEEEAQRVLDDYTDAIHALREKNFTFREIAEWLGKFGFEVDHNAVWRAYAKTVSDGKAHHEAREDEQLESEESHREAALNAPIASTGDTFKRPTAPPADKIVRKPQVGKAVRKSTK